MTRVISKIFRSDTSSIIQRRGLKPACVRVILTQRIAIISTPRYFLAGERGFAAKFFFSVRRATLVLALFMNALIMNGASTNKRQSRFGIEFSYQYTSVTLPKASSDFSPGVQWARKKKTRETTPANSVSLEAIWTLIYALALDPRPKAPV